MGEWTYVFQPQVGIWHAEGRLGLEKLAEGFHLLRKRVGFFADLHRLRRLQGCYCLPPAPNMPIPLPPADSQILKILAWKRGPLMCTGKVGGVGRNLVTLPIQSFSPS